MALDENDIETRTLNIERKVNRLRAILDEMVIFRLPRLEQQIAMLWSLPPRRVAQITGQVDGCAEMGFPGATIRVLSPSGERLGTGKADSSGHYTAWANLESDPQTVEIEATPVGDYEDRFDGPAVESLEVAVGGNTAPTITIPPAEDWCCGEEEYWPGECGPATCLWTLVVNDPCTSKPLPGSLVTLSQDGDEVASCETTGQVASITQTNGGSNYQTPPTATISGDGSGATATPVMQLAGLARSNGGSGYTDGFYPGMGTFSGGGATTQATFTFAVSGGVIGPTITLVTRGEGYTSLPTPDFSAAGAGTGATLTVRLNVKSTTVTNGGSGYTAATVAFSGGSGTGAAGTPVVAARCTLDVPLGDYDVTVDPPSGSPYEAYSGTASHTCGQSTTFTLNVDEDHACGANCTVVPCKVWPKVMHLTWTFNPSYLGYRWPDDACELVEPVVGGVPSWRGVTAIPNPFTDGLGHYDVDCGGAVGYRFDASGTTASIESNITGTVTCEPYSLIGGGHATGVSYDLIGGS